VSLSRARFTSDSPDGNYVPEAVGTVVSGGAALDNFHRVFGALRVRYFGPRALIEDDSVRSKQTTLVNLEGGYQLTKNVRANLDVFNLFDSQVSDIDYFFTSRLPGEPLEGVDDIHFHPAVPRTARLSLIVGF
jgi:outer membrane receptor protein involved in Fe transport